MRYYFFLWPTSEDIMLTSKIAGSYRRHTIEKPTKERQKGLADESVLKGES